MKKTQPKLIVSDAKGRIYGVSFLEAAGMKAGNFFRLKADDLIKIPYGSELFVLPDRMPVGYDPAEKRFISTKGLFPVAAFISPGYTATYNSCFIEKSGAAILPLFSYAAAALYKGDIYAAGLLVDREKRHDIRVLDMDLVKRNIKRYRDVFSANRLVRHLERCALQYGCAGAKGFFLSKYEAPLPSSPRCNARCMGCISYQPDKRCPVAQPRITFIPRPEEIADVAVYHIKNTADPVVSFGQGCEGEPLLCAAVLERSIRLIRKMTNAGMININTNASRPDTIIRLLDAGLDSVRVSLNSARKEYYSRYYRPRGYSFKDVLRSITIVKKKGRFVSVNYLVMPGFTDSTDEYEAFRDFLGQYKIDMVQWRNLNYDPLRYFRELRFSAEKSDLLGIREIIASLLADYPLLLSGYFNPSRAKISRLSAQRP